MATQGPNSPGTMANDASFGSFAWVNPNNAKVSDNTYADGTGTALTDTQFLVATNFGFSIPAGATIDGISVEVEKGGAGSYADLAARLVKAGTIGSIDRNLTNWSNPESYDLFGSSTELWGDTWTADDINNSGFGFAYACERTAGTPDAPHVDHIRITVYYTSGGRALASSRGTASNRNLSSNRGVASRTLV